MKMNFFNLFSPSTNVNGWAQTLDHGIMIKCSTAVLPLGTYMEDLLLEFEASLLTACDTCKIVNTIYNITAKTNIKSIL
jgi:hypothetical protein